MLDPSALAMAERERIGSVETGFSEKALERQANTGLDLIVGDIALFSLVVRALVSIIIVFLSDLVFKVHEALREKTGLIDFKVFAPHL